MSKNVWKPGQSGNPAGPKPARGLFVENHKPNVKNSERYTDIEPPYSLAEFRSAFLAAGDLTEYKAALKCVGSWEEWERIKRDWPGFCKHIDAWKEELQLHLKGKALQKVVDLLECGVKGTEMAAARFLARGEWVRSVKEEREESDKRQDRKAEEALEKKMGTQEDWERVNQIIAIEGGKK
ncbi:MAG: hypothetical protein ACXABY_11960 [Candidatus Thorarchaeota archaeon]|jgi:hypothetical protein